MWHAVAAGQALGLSRLVPQDLVNFGWEQYRLHNGISGVTTGPVERNPGVMALNNAASRLHEPI
jgi:hypothetical protein